ncbi:hypothetical protein H2248_011861 [Termitomyces sp. 'cryptogamus']|nr:hypothetical protein H2248_011861 [Termitomyces sp. 'cryptogamus']
MAKSLIVGDILAVLFSRFEEGTFHWAICIPLDDSKAAKYHVRQSHLHWWFEDPVPEHDILVSQTLSAAIKIGSLNPDVVSRDILRDILMPIPIAVPDVDKDREPRFTCRVWFREAIRRLHNHRVILCSNVDELEKECNTYALGNQAAYATWGAYDRKVSQYSV